MGFKVKDFVVKYGSSHCSFIFQVRARSVKGNNIFFKQHCCLHVIIENNVETVSVDLSMNPSPAHKESVPAPVTVVPSICVFPPRQGKVLT